MFVCINLLLAIEKVTNSAIMSLFIKLNRQHSLTLILLLDNQQN